MHLIPSRRILKALGLAGLLSATASERSAIAAPPSPPKPAPAAQAKPAPAPEPNSGPELLGWLRVTNDTAPFLEEPEDDELEGVMARGELVEKRVETRPAFINTKALTFQMEGPEGPIKREGAITAIRLSGEDIGFTFSSDLGPAPKSLPTRAQVCAALAASTPPAMEREFCDSEGRILLLESSKSAGKRAVVWGHLRSKQTSRVATIDLDAVAVHKPAVLDVREFGFAVRLIAAPLPDGGTWLIAQEKVPQGGPHDWQLGFFVVDPTGKISPAKSVPLETHEVKRPNVTNYKLYTRLDRSPKGPSLVLDGTEEVEDIASGAKKSQRQVKQLVTWDAAQKQVVVREVKP